MIRVLLADDHVTVRHGLKMILDAQPDIEIVGEAGTGHLAVQQACALNPTVIVLDISMPELSGISAAREIAAAAPGVGIVVLTRHTDAGYVEAVLGAGAMAYVLKQSASSELLSAIRAAAAGRRYLDASLTDRVTGAYIAKHSTGETGRRVSQRETEVLKLIALGHSNSEIADRLGLSVKTVEVHKANVMRKLQLRGRVDIVRFAARQRWLEDA